MKIRRTVLFISVLVFFSPQTHGQGILNGGFELYNPDTKFLEGWHARSGAGEDYGTVVGGVSGSLLDYITSTPPRLFAAVAGPAPTLEDFPFGNYWLYAGGPATTIEQRFFVPTDTGSLQYRALNGYLGGVSVQIDGITLEPQVKATVHAGGPQSGTIQDWWVDMRPYAGNEVNLTFYIGQAHAGIDDVHISTEIVPEPSVIALGALGAVGLLAARRNRTSST